MRTGCSGELLGDPYPRLSALGLLDIIPGGHGDRASRFKLPLAHPRT